MTVNYEPQPRIASQLFINTATQIETCDDPHPTLPMRVVVLRIADFTIHFSGNDEEIASTAVVFQNYLEVIRKAAAWRAEDADLALRDAQIDAGLGTGYVGEFR